jgi:hypothetical protein
MAKVKFKISKKTRFMSHMFASACFIGLFIWGWDLSVSDALAYLLVSLGLLGVIIVISAVLGLVLRFARRTTTAAEEE